MLIAAKRMMKAFMTGPSALVRAIIIFRTALIFPNILSAFETQRLGDNKRVGEQDWE